MELAAADLSAEEEAQLDDQSHAALVSARRVQQFEPAGDGGAAGEQAFVWLGLCALDVSHVRARSNPVPALISTQHRLTL